VRVEGPQTTAAPGKVYSKMRSVLLALKVAVELLGYVGARVPEAG